MKIKSQLFDLISLDPIVQWDHHEKFQGKSLFDLLEFTNLPSRYPVPEIPEIRWPTSLQSS